MNGRLDLAELLFSSAGRLARASFVATATVLIGAAWLFRAFAPDLVARFVAYPFLLFCGAAITCKRLHDRDRSGWWAFFVLVALGAVWNGARSVVTLPAWLALAWAAVELCVLPGEPGANRYGPSPLRWIKV